MFLGSTLRAAQADLVDVIDSRGRVLTPCRRKVAEKEVNLNRAKWLGPNKIRLRFDPFAYRYIRLKVLARDSYSCYWCGEPGFTIDHIVPWSKGGRTTMDNCVCACQECNGARGDMPAEEFAALRKVPMPRVIGGALPTVARAVAREEAAAAAEAPAAEPSRPAAPAVVTVAEPGALRALLDPHRGWVSARSLR